jgi:DNA-binding YbaB/EbfC family protein
VFKGLGNFAALLKQAQQIGSRMNQVSEELKGQRAAGTAGGGLVEVEVNGLGEMLACRIDPKFFAQQDRELLEDLVTAAVNQAQAKAKELHAEALKSVTGGMDMQGLDETLARLAGGQGPPAEG